MRRIINMAATHLNNEFLIEASWLYYEYAKDKQLGQEEITICQISHGVFGLSLTLQSRIFSLEGLIIQYDNQCFDLNQSSPLIPVAYDEKQKILHLEFDPTSKQTLTPHSKNIRLFCDLSFLIQNVMTFYASYPNLSLPTQAPKLNPPPKIQSMHQNQLQALHAIFKEPLCYIWGAAGCGKTKVVLFHALALYIKAGYKVILLAPTNNALEQSLFGLLENFEQLGIDLGYVLRLGIPSQSFLQRFPLCCDPLQSNKAQYKKLISQSHLIATTLDTYLKRIEIQELDFDHYFLDEAAYAPLIKTLPLCTKNKPITLLGDHKQLSPIYTIAKADESSRLSCKIWKYSSLHLLDFFTNGINLNDNNAPIQTFPTTYKLTHTYRYGNNLAQILDRFIYQNGLVGLNDQTFIQSLHTPNNITHNTNPNEAKAASTIAQELIKQNKEFAIITPFVSQRGLLLRLMPSLAESILTIHKSQGQEFDYVIFSPVMLHWHLSNSNNKQALYTLNVAISRAKKGLILVCDKPYWLKRSNQFLAHLLKIAQDFDFSLPF